VPKLIVDVRPVWMARGDKDAATSAFQQRKSCLNPSRSAVDALPQQRCGIAPTDRACPRQQKRPPAGSLASAAAKGRHQDMDAEREYPGEEEQRRGEACCRSTRSPAGRAKIHSVNDGAAVRWWQVTAIDARRFGFGTGV